MALPGPMAYPGARGGWHPLNFDMYQDRGVVLFIDTRDVGGVVGGGGTLEDSLATRAGRLFELYRAGDQDRMAELVKILTPILWHTARAARLDAATAEDVLQMVWLTLIRKADTITEPRAVLQWMVVTAKREAWRVARAQARVRPDDLEASGAGRGAATESVEDLVVRATSDHRLWQHVEGLPERCRALLRVIAFADRPDYEELALALGMPQGSIGPTRGRCLAKLRLALAQDPTWEAK
jgi:RNA polymerase sigma factor (sigma-70 family)